MDITEIINTSDITCLLNTNKFSRYETTRELSELIKSIV